MKHLNKIKLHNNGFSKKDYLVCRKDFVIRNTRHYFLFKKNVHYRILEIENITFNEISLEYELVNPGKYSRTLFNSEYKKFFSSINLLIEKNIKKNFVEIVDKFGNKIIF